MPVLTTTTNNAFRYPTSANNGTDFATGIADFATDVDAMVLSGTFVSRPAAGLVNRQFFATDTGVWYQDTGSAWFPMVVSGGGISHLLTTATSSNIVAHGGQHIEMNGPHTVTLPTPVNGEMVAVSVYGVSGDSPAIVQTPGVAHIFGVRGIGVTSLIMGMPGSALTFLCDGTNWVIVSGPWDTGWVSVSFYTGLAAATPCQCRLEGDTVSLTGMVQNVSGNSIAGATTPLFVIPGFAVPSHALYIPASSPNTGTNTLQVGSDSNVTWFNTIARTQYVSLDGVSYKVV